MGTRSRRQRRGSYNRQMSRMTMKPGNAVGPRGATVTQPPKSWPGICFDQGSSRAYKIGTSTWSEATLVRADGTGHSIITVTGLPGIYRVVNCSPGMTSG